MNTMNTHVIISTIKPSFGLTNNAIKIAIINIANIFKNIIKHSKKIEIAGFFVSAVVCLL